MAEGSAKMRRLNRLRVDVEELRNNTQGIVILDMDDDFTSFQLAISGPIASPYEGGLFTVEMDLPQDYPRKPPLMSFTVKVWHPNISLAGTVCVDILSSEDWVCGTTLLQAVEVLQGLLANPNEASPLNSECAAMIIEDKDMFVKTAQTWTACFAGGTYMCEEHRSKIDHVATLCNGDTAKAVEVLSENKWDLAITLGSM